MADLILDKTNILPVETVQAPAMIAPRPFVLSEQEPEALSKLSDEVMDKIQTWDTGMNKIFQEMSDGSQMWRVLPRDPSSSKPRGFHNYRSGEMHRAVETFATTWFRMLTSDAQFYSAVGRGLDYNGNALSEEDIYAVESVLLYQLRKTGFKHELLTSLRSLGLWGTLIFEEPWVRRLNLNGKTYFEGTGMVLKSLLSTAFDMSAYDINDSDFIATIDYPTIWRVKQWLNSSPEVWDKSIINKVLSETEYYSKSGEVKTDTNALNRITERKQRAGIFSTDKNVRELINYHGKLDINNSVIGRLWESLGIQDDPANYDFTLGLLNGKQNVVRFHVTQYGTWRSKFKVAYFKKFELEPLGYGAYKTGHRIQKDLDRNFSRVSDIIMMATYSTLR